MKEPPSQTNLKEAVDDALERLAEWFSWRGESAKEGFILASLSELNKRKESREITWIYKN